jgi:hypothetical protein
MTWLKQHLTDDLKKTLKKRRRKQDEAQEVESLEEANRRKRVKFSTM